MTKSKVPSNRGNSPNHVVFGPYGGRDAVEEADLKHEAIEDGDEIFDPPPFDATARNSHLCSRRWRVSLLMRPGRPTPCPRRPPEGIGGAGAAE